MYVLMYLILVGVMYLLPMYLSLRPREKALWPYISGSELCMTFDLPNESPTGRPILLTNQPTTQSAAPGGAPRPGRDDGAAAAPRRRLHRDGQEVLHADPGVRQGRRRRPLPRQHARRVLQKQLQRRGEQQGVRR